MYATSSPQKALRNHNNFQIKALWLRGTGYVPFFHRSKIIQLNFLLEIDWCRGHTRRLRVRVNNIVCNLFGKKIICIQKFAISIDFLLKNVSHSITLAS